MISGEQFQEWFPRAIDPFDWADALNQNLPLYDITTPKRIAAFISQCAVETGGWRWFEENMNYSADRMMVVWPNRFDRTLADICHRRPELVANHAYANRMGNGDPESGDGWRFRGRGPIHLTGRNNYTRFAEDTFDDPFVILDNPDLVAHDKDISLKSALWFWDINGLNSLADAGMITKLSRKVNGGNNGLKERLALFDVILTSIA